MEHSSTREKIDDELIVGMEVRLDEKAFNLSNTSSLRKRFSIRKGHIRRDALKKY